MPTRRLPFLALIATFAIMLFVGLALAEDPRTDGQHPLFYLKKISLDLKVSGDPDLSSCGLDRGTLETDAAAHISASPLKITASSPDARYRVNIIIVGDAEVCSGYVGSEVFLRIPVDPPFRSQARNPYAPFTDVILWRNQGVIVRPTEDFAGAVHELVEEQAGRFVKDWKAANSL